MQLRNYRKPTSRFTAWTLSATAIASMMTPAAIVAPAQAAVLHGWNFDPSTEAVTITLPDGITPKFFLLAEPARIVLEIPEATLGTLNPAQAYEGAVRSVRLSEVSSGARVVIELAPNARLDPRHAELTATVLDNGQTEWTLRPLLQGSPPAPVAAAPQAAPTAAESLSVAGSPASTPAVAAPAPESTATSAQEGISDADAAVEASDDVSESDDAGETEAIASTDSDGTTSDESITATESATEASADDTAIPLEVNPAPELPAVPDDSSSTSPSLPEIANAATVGAVRSLPTGPDPLAGVSTDASALAGAGDVNLDDLPPGEIPLDPFAAASQGAVSVPSLAEADSTPAPAVSVPSLAATTATEGAPPASPTAAGIPANQVRPPGAAGVSPGAPVAESVPPAPAIAATAPPPETVTPPIPLPPEVATADTTPVTALEVPNLPGPPDTWSDRGNPTNEPSQITPPATTATAPTATEYITEPPPQVIATAPTTTEYITEPPPTAAIATAPATEYITEPPPQVTATAPTATEYITEPPPQVAVTAPATEYITEPPPTDAPTAPTTAYITEPPPAAPVADASSVAEIPANAGSTEVAVVPPQPDTAGSASDSPPFISPPSSPNANRSGRVRPFEQPSIPPPPAIGGPDAVPFGAPLPQTQSSIEGTPSRLDGYNSVLPSGVRLPLQYIGAGPLELSKLEPTYQTLSLVEDVYDPDTGLLLLPSGTQVLGRFEGAGDSGRFVAESVVYGRDRFPLAAESALIVGNHHPSGDDSAASSSIGAAAVTILTGFTGFGLIGGAAAGALTSFAQSPALVTIAPGTIIEVEVVTTVSSIHGISATS